MNRSEAIEFLLREAESSLRYWGDATDPVYTALRVLGVADHELPEGCSPPDKLE